MKRTSQPTDIDITETAELKADLWGHAMAASRIEKDAYQAGYRDALQSMRGIIDLDEKLGEMQIIAARILEKLEMYKPQIKAKDGYGRLEEE